MPQWLSEKELVVTSDLVMDYRRLGLELGLADLDLKSFECFALHEQCLKMLLLWIHNVMEYKCQTFWSHIARSYIEQPFHFCRQT